MFKTINGGDSWAAFNTDLTNTNITALAIGPQQPDTLYTGTGDGVFKTINGGGNWTNVNSDLTSTSISALAIDPLNPDTAYVGAGGVFKTINGGGNWTDFNTGLTNTVIQALAIDPLNSNTLYVGTSGGGVFDIELGSTAVPTLTSVSPISVLAGGSAFTLTVSGTNFVSGSIVRWNDANRATSYVSSTQLTATIPATDIAATGVGYVTVFNPSPGGGTSNPQAVYITMSSAVVTNSNTASGTNPTATIGGSTGISATAAGAGTVSVASYASNPGGATSFNSAGAFMDTHVESGNTFTSLTIVDCDLNGGNKVYWWNDTNWALASNQNYNATTQCVTITVTSSSSPSLSDLTGTPFGAAINYTLHLPLVIR